MRPGDSLWEACAASGGLRPGRRRACGLGSCGLVNVVLLTCTLSHHTSGGQARSLFLSCARGMRCYGKPLNLQGAVALCRRFRNSSLESVPCNSASAGDSVS